jgi:HSP20 family protein
MDEATRLPVKTEKRAPVAAPAQWTPFESIRREIDRVFDRFHMGAWDFPFGRRAFEFEFPWPRVASGRCRGERQRIRDHRRIAWDG